MKKTILTLILLIFINLIGFSQNSKVTKILEEGKLLYRLERASWFGTDDFLERFNHKKDSIGGYLSYQTEDNKINCIFYSRYNNNEILVRYQFDSLPKQTPIEIDTINKNASKIERDLIEIREDARNRVYENSDNFFTFYENTSLNFIPVITKKEKKVFIVTAPIISGIVLLGNDYILKYSKKNKFKSQKKLHNTIIQFPYKSKNSDNPIFSTIHSHVVTDYITSTDICTLLLYKDYVEWKTHFVVGKKHVSIFDMEKEILTVMPKKAWNKIYNNKK